MAFTYDPIASTTLTAQGTFTFNNIPQTYTDLVLIVSGVVGVASTAPRLQFNGDTGTNYNTLYFSANTTTLYTGGSGAVNSLNLTNNSTQWGTSGINNTIINIFNYARTDKNKIVTFETANAGTAGQSFAGGRWASLNAITSIFCAANITNNFGSGTQATLYGIKAA